MTESSDLTLVRQCLEGQRDAFGMLVMRHHKAVFNVTLRMIKDVQDAQDVVQTVFLKAYEKLGTFDARFKFFSWIYRMAVNESLNFLKRRRRWEGLDEGRDYAAAAETVEENDMGQTIQNALMFLKVEHRAVIILKHLEGLSYEEIAFILEVPTKTVKSRLFSARQMLKTILLKQGYADHDRR
ncbi:sigma-70 family RNA polymerase sigma factor [candidate division KSB1 bacterium]|nr:sigma-70 family RNA polymerase sigma factor [candidate division KSB1 bacterium]